MIKNYLLTAIRNIIRQPIFSIINISGLAIAVTCVICITLWVQDELSFDKFHNRSDRIYRIIMNMGQYGNLAVTPPPLINKMKDDFPEVVTVTRIKECSKVIIKNEDRIFYEDDGLFVDPGFFKMFSFNLIKGSHEELLDEPFNMVITEDMADKYFGEDDPVNKILFDFSIIRNLNCYFMHGPIRYGFVFSQATH